MNTYASLFVVAVVAAVGTVLARVYALRRRLLDEPGERRSHAVATPRGGGLGPVVAVLAWLLFGPGAGQADGLLVALSLAGVAVVGLWDDHASLPASTRLLVHVIAGIAIAAAVAEPTSRAVEFLAVVAIVAVLVNVWNFMDGINGIAASQGVIVGVGVALVAPQMRIPALVVAAACLGFLPFNFPRARIFLGDVGSGALGLLIAWLAAGAALTRPANGLLLALPLSAFMTDAGLTLLRRIIRRERWWEPHAQHLYQLLARRHGHVRVTMAYAAWSVLASALMVAAAARPLAFTMASCALCYMTAASLWLWLQHPVATDGDATTTRDT